MGVWNQTCALSNLPITDGDKIKLVFLLPNGNPYKISGMSSVNDSDDILQPFLLPISGRYDECGGIEDINYDWNTDIVFVALKHYLGDKIIVDDKEFDANYTILDIIRGIKTRLIYFKSNSREIYLNKYYKIQLEEDGKPRDSELCFVMIREDVWNSVNEKSICEYFFNGSGTLRGECTKDNYFLYNFNEMKNIVENTASFKYMEEYCFYVNFDTAYSIINRYDNLLYMNKFADDENHRIINSDFFKQWSEFITIKLFFESIRKLWMITTGEGSQTEDWHNHKILAEITIDVCDSYMSDENKCE